MALLELIYTSIAEPINQTKDVKDILNASERNNKAASITGLLLFDSQRYIQILEGDADDVEKLYQVIGQDTRHHSLELLHKGEVTGRSFDEWRMAYEALPKGLLNELAENMAVYSLELDTTEPLGAGESFGAKLHGMFMDAMAAE
jgi:hypothetical protein